MSTHGARSALAKVLFGASLLLQGSTHAGEARPFQATFTGTYHVAFGAGTNGNHRLTFQGFGSASHAGNTAIDGRSEMAPGSRPNCTSIENDWVVLTAANGDELWQVNSGEDCMEITPTGIVIKGSGTMTIVGGTGRFAGASGLGAWVVTAPVTRIEPTGADGTFELSFSGGVSY